MFIHIASDFLSTHIKCFLCFWYFVHDNFCVFSGFTVYAESSCYGCEEHKCSMNEKTNKLINIQSFDGREACRERNAEEKQTQWCSAKLWRVVFRYQDVFLYFENYSIMKNLDAFHRSHFEWWLFLLKRNLLSRTIENADFSFACLVARLQIVNYSWEKLFIYYIFFVIKIHDKYCHVTS